MTIRTDRVGSFGRLRRDLGVLLGAALALAWSDPQLGVRVNHDLGPGELVFGWGLDATGERMIYSVARNDFGSGQIFSVSIDGSQDALALTERLPSDRTVSSVTISPDGRRIVFLSNLETRDKSELYSVTTDGSRVPVKLNNPLLANEIVGSLLEFTPDGSRVLYLTLVLGSGRSALNSAPTDGSQPAVTIQVPEAGGVVPNFRATSDSHRVIYYRPGRLLSAPVDGSAPPIQISHSAPGEQPDIDYLLSPDGRFVVYFSRTLGGSDIFSARVDGSAPPRPLFFRGKPGQATELDSSTPNAFQVSPDSRFVVGITNGFRELRIAPIDGSSKPVVLADPENVFRSNFRITLDGRIVFEASPLGVTVQQRGMFTVPMDGSAKASRILGVRGDPWPLKHEVSPGGDVVFIGHTGSWQLLGKWQLYSVPIDGGAPPQQLNPPLVAGGVIANANIINSPSFQFSPDGSWVLYAATQETLTDRELFAVAPDGSRPAQKVNGPLPTGGDVLSYVFAPDSRRVLYSVWTSTTREVFTSVLADSDSRAIERPIGNTATQPLLEGGLVEDPRRIGRVAAAQ